MSMITNSCAGECAKNFVLRQHGEKMHPGLGPAAERTLYIRQLKIIERLQKNFRRIVIWDIVSAAAANAIALFAPRGKFSSRLRIFSFDNTHEPLAFH